MAAWVDGHEADRLSYLETQYLLAAWQSGLIFTNRRVSDTLRGLAFLYAASNLKRYLMLHDADWPRRGRAVRPPLGAAQR